MKHPTECLRFEGHSFIPYAVMHPARNVVQYISVCQHCHLSQHLMEVDGHIRGGTLQPWDDIVINEGDNS